MQAIYFMLALISICLMISPTKPQSEENPDKKAGLKTYSLPRLKSFWTGAGVSIAYPGRLLMTSDKLRYQMGWLSSISQFDLGTYFSTEVTLVYHITEERNSRQTFVFALSSNKATPAPMKLNSHIDKDNYIPLPEKFEGFVILIEDFDTVHTGWFNSNNVSREEIMARGKVCKVSAKKRSQLRFLLKLEGDSLTLYFEDDRDLSLRICGQFTNIRFQQPQYIQLGASDDAGLAQITVSDFNITTNSQYEVVPAKDKNLGDSFLAYWDEDANSKNQSPSADISNFKSAALYYYDNSKIYSEELLILADKSIPDLKQELAQQTDNHLKRMKGAVDVIGKEADMLEALGWVLTESKNQHKYNIQKVLDMTIDWLDSIEESIDKTDAETIAIHELVSKLNLQTITDELMVKTQELISNLKKLNFKATHLIDDNTMNIFDDVDTLKDWQGSFQNFEDSVTNSAKQKNRKGYLFGLGVFWLVGGAVLIGLIWMYCKLQGALSKNNRSF